MFGGDHRVYNVVNLLFAEVESVSQETDRQSGKAEDSAAIIIANHLKYTEVEGKKRECEKVPVIVADSSHRTEKTVSLLLIDK